MRLPFTQMQTAVGAGAFVVLVLLLLLVVLIRRSRAKAKRRARTEAALAEPRPAPPAPPPAVLTEAEAAWFAAAHSPNAPSPMPRPHLAAPQAPAQPPHPIEYFPTEPIPTSPPTAVGLAPEPSAGHEQNGAPAPGSAGGNGNGHGHGNGANREATSAAATSAPPEPVQAASAGIVSATESQADAPEHAADVARTAHAKDRLLQVLLIDPDRALHAVNDLEVCRNQLDQLNEAMDQQLRLLADAARRLRGAGLTPAQVARLAGCGEGELASLLAEHAPAPAPRP